MISYLCGTIKFIAPSWLILDVNGVGYKIQLKIKNLKPASPAGGLKIGEQCELFIHHHIREDASDLYGLETPEELQMFELLVSVSGVGPKMAMNILSTYNTARISQIIINSDASSLTAVSGVGKKLSMKMILDLKSKLDSGAISSFSDFDNSNEDLFDALESLGYKKYEVTPFLLKIPQELQSLEDKVKWILKNSKK